MFRMKSPAPAPISCSPNLSQRVCKASTGIFSATQQVSDSMRQVEIVITDKKGLEQEKNRITTIYGNSLRRDPANAERNKPALPCAFDDDFLFEIDSSGMIGKVFVSAEFFRKPDSTKTGDADSDEFDIDMAFMGSHFVLGYVDGYMYSRAHTMAEFSETQGKH